MSEDVRRSKEAGFEFHLTKPVDVTELRSVLRKLGTKNAKSFRAAAGRPPLSRGTNSVSSHFSSAGSAAVFLAEFSYR